MARQQSKDLHQKHQAILSKLLKDDDNKYCVDCDAKGPRWASWNIGVFLCIRCAGIHRNLGVHISKVKSINLDSWTAEQIASVEDMGNSRARAVYEANLPDHYKRPSTADSAMEQFIRAKYEHRKYIAKEWVPPKPRSVPSHYYDTEEPKKEPKKHVKTVLTIPGAAAGTAAVARTTAEKKVAAPVKAADTTPSLMVDVSAPPNQAPAAKPPTTSADLLTDIFTSPAPAPTSASDDLFGLSSTETVQHSSGDTSEDLFKVDEKGTSAKDSIMALFGNTSAPQPNMMQGAYNMPQGAYPQVSQGMMPGMQPQAMPGMQQQAMPGMMPGQFQYSQQAHGQMTGSTGMMPGYSMAAQQPNMMMSSQMAMPAQGMMGQPMMGMAQPGAYGNPQMQQQLYAQQMQAQMANLSLNQQQMNGMAKQGTTGNSGASWGGASAQTNGQTLNGALWN